MNVIEEYKQWLNKEDYMKGQKNGVYVRTLGLEPWQVFTFAYDKIKKEEVIKDLESFKEEKLIKKETINVKAAKNTRRKKPNTSK